MDQLKGCFVAQNIHLPNPLLRNLHQEALRKNVNTAQVVEFWKNADIKEFCSTGGVACSVLNQAVRLSPQKSAKSAVISQQLILQINCVRDVSKPAYQQLLAVIKRNDQNALIDADNEVTAVATRANENGRRMLHITFTDGVKEIIGMEYQPIPHLSTDTPPGTKVRIVPPVIFRRGTLVLQAKNVQLIGGRVEQLAVTFAQKYVLASLINADLAKLEKAVPPCPPPIAAQQNAAPAPPPNNNQPNPPQNMNGGDFLVDDPDEDAFLASVSVPGWDDNTDDDLFNEVLDAVENQHDDLDIIVLD